MSWTDERVELLSQLWLEGRSASQISAVLGAGFTRNAVIGKVHRLGLAGRAKTMPSGISSGASSISHGGGPSTRRVSPRSSSGGGAILPAAVANGGAARIVHGNNALVMQSEVVSEVAPATRVEEDVVVPMSLRVTIVELKESMCKWPLGDPASSEFRYCGSPAPGATPYCVNHSSMAYQPAQDRRRERDRDRRTLLAR